MSLSTKRNKFDTLKTRAIFGCLMFVGFLIVIILGEKMMMLFVCVISLLSVFEQINLVRNIAKTWPLDIYSCICVTILCFLFPLYSSLGFVINGIHKYLSVIKFRAISYYIYCLFFIKLILSLRKSRLKKQLTILLAIHLIPVVLGNTCKFAIHNILNSTYYLIVPSLLVIINDTAAYFIGKSFGKTKIFTLSPNKTVEGFIGGAVFSFVGAILVSLVKIRFMDIYGKSNCFEDSFVIIPFINAKCYLVFFINLILFLGSSIVAPFMGFLASAFKRFFKKKDFGCIIPEHGGITDRFDCHIMMVWFTYYFIKAFSINKPSHTVDISSYIIQNYSNSEIKEIAQFLLNKY